MINFQNLDLFSVGIVIVATLILGFVVFLSNSKSVTHRSFFGFSIFTVLWGIGNFLNYQPFPVDTSFFLLKLSIFFAVWHTFFLYRFLNHFPSDKNLLSKFQNYTSILLAITASALTLTPLVFNKVVMVSDTGSIAQVENGPGIVVFGIAVVGFVTFGIYSLIRKIISSEGQLRKQLISIAFGIVLTFGLVLTFNFISPAFLNNPNYQIFGAVFIFPFLVSSAYAIFKHKFLDVKVISTEILTFALAIITLIEVIVSDSIIVLFFRVFMFSLVVLIGLLLIRSVIREVKQREQLEILTNDLEVANDKLQQLDKARAEFISIASHQLRTPPATIKWYVNAILNGDFGDLSEELRAALERVNSTNNSQISLIDDLLNASRIERGKLEFYFEPESLIEITKLTVDQLVPQAQMKKLELKFVHPKIKLTNVMMDKEKVRQVINNFIDNAIKYTKEGLISVIIEQTQTEQILRVKDSGRGVDSATAKSLFEKYSRGKDSATESTGLGLGLYVAKVIIEQNDGRIWVESDGIGKGATFAFALPILSKLEATSTVDLAKSH